MDTRGMLITQAQGASIDSTGETNAFLPQVPAALRDIYVRAKHSVGGGRVRTTLLFGDVGDKAGHETLAPTIKRNNGLKPLPMASLFDTTAGWSSAQLLTWPKARVRILNTSYRAWHVTAGKIVASDIDVTFGGAIGFGTSALAAYATITNCARSNIIPASTFTAGSTLGTNYPTTTYSVVHCTAQQYNATITGLLDNSGGTSGGKTLATILQTGTIPTGTGVMNAIATLSAAVNEILFLLAGRVTGSNTTLTSAVVPVPQVYDGTSTAISLYANMLISATEQTASANTAAGQPVYLEGRLVIDWEYIDPIPQTITISRPEGQG